MLSRKISLSLFFTAVAVASHSSPLHAEKYIPPEDIKVSTPVYKPEFSEFKPVLGTYNYTVSWQGIPAADVKASVEQEGMSYRIVTSVKTYSGIDIFYKLRYRAEGLISSVDLNPLQTTIDHKENSRDRRIEMKFNPNGEIETTRIDYKKDETKTIKFDPHNFMLDPFSAAFLARSLKWEVGETKKFDLFNGKSRYLIALTAEEKRKMKVNGEEKEVWVISPTVQNLSYPDSNGKLRKASIYVTADKDRDILQIVSSVYIGSVTTKLDSFTPSELQMQASIAKNKTDTFIK